MTGQQPILTGGEDRVVQFRPRKVAKPEIKMSRPANPAGITSLAAQYPAAHNPAAQRDDKRQAARAPGHTLSRRGRAARPDRTAERDDVDYRHRLVTSLAALAFTLLLTGAAVWLATTIADIRKTPDCVLLGQRDCPRPPLPNVLPVRLNDHI